MRNQIFFLFLLIGQQAFSQGTRVDFAKLETSPDKNDLVDAYKNHFAHLFNIQPALNLDHLYIKNHYAFLIGEVKDGTGKEIDFARFDPAKQKSSLVFKGQETRALLKKVGSSWKVLAILVSPDDQQCSCWWAEYNAPKELFDYTDYCR